VLGARFSAQVHRDVPVPMRDGTLLRADVWIPDRAERVPVLLERMPYDKSISAITTVEAGLDPLRAVDAGYAVVVQDTRGRFTSDGTFDPYVNEVRDGVDTIQWCADLPFSNGRVGMFGASYFGATQLLAATAGPPALQALVPTITGSDFYEGWTYQGGAFQLGLAQLWSLLILAPDVIARMPADERPGFEEALSEALRDPLQTYSRLPLSDLAGLEAVMPFYRDWLSHDTRDEYWRTLAPKESYAAFRTPALHIGGWYDIFIAGTIENYTGLRQGAGTTSAREGQRLLVGPWAHGNFSDTIGDLSFGIHSAKNALDATAIHVAFFDEHLRDLPCEGPRVRYFLMGANTWVEDEDWPRAARVLKCGSCILEVRQTRPPGTACCRRSPALATNLPTATSTTRATPSRLSGERRFSPARSCRTTQAQRSNPASSNAPMSSSTRVRRSTAISTWRVPSRSHCPSQPRRPARISRRSLSTCAPMARHTWCAMGSCRCDGETTPAQAVRR
jgi:putative CocE/NonD family hydrolase